MKCPFKKKKNVLFWDPLGALPQIALILFRLQTAPPIHLCSALWDNGVHQQHTRTQVSLVCILLSLSMLNFSTLSVWMLCILRTICTQSVKWSEMQHMSGFLPLDISTMDRALRVWLLLLELRFLKERNSCSTCLHTEHRLAAQQRP